MLSRLEKRQRKKKLKRLLLFLCVISVVIFVFFNTKKTNLDKKENIVSPLANKPTLTPTNTPIPLQNSEGLQKTISEALAGTHGTYGIVVKNLKTEESYYAHQTHVFKAGSLYKLWVMATVFEQIKSGKLTEDLVLSKSVTDLNKAFRLDPNLAEKKDGTITFSVKDALYQMITISDNYAALLLAQKVGLSNIATFLKQNEFSNSRVGVDGKDPVTTPLDISLFFEKLYKGQLINSDYSDKMLTLLKWQRLNNKIPKYLPDNLPVAHKTGELDEVTHDAGIVFSDYDDYILVVLSESNSRDLAEERIANVSKNVYNYFENLLPSIAP